MILSKRVVVTGLGLVTPVGIGVKTSWKALCAGKSGVGPITQFDTSDLQTKIAAEVKDFKAEDWLPKKEARRTERFIAFAMAASRMAAGSTGACSLSEPGFTVHIKAGGKKAPGASVG